MRVRALVIVPALLLAGCGREEPRPTPPPPPPAAAAWPEVAPPQQTPAQQAQAAKAAAARDALAKRLQGRVMEAVATQGAAAAIGVCRGEAPALTTEVAREHGVRIGRTAERLRSLMNGAPAWAGTLVATRRETPAFLAGPDGTLGALYPIRLQALCVGCHGAREALAPDVRAALERDYPSDRATGFSEGDLRGWIWVEVPAP